MSDGKLVFQRPHDGTGRLVFSDAAELTTEGVKVFNGVSWVAAVTKRWTGAVWEACVFKRFDGAVWTDLP